LKPNLVMRPADSSRKLALSVIAICSLSVSVADLPTEVAVVKIDGSSTVYPIMRLAAQAFEEQTGGKARVNVAFSGTTGGFRKFLEGEVDIADASRPILKAEMEEARARGVEYLEIPIAYDALTIAVHPENTWAESIKVSELKRLWEATSETKVTNWNQIRPEWPDAELKLYGPGRDSGTFDYFSEVVLGKRDGLRRDYIDSEDDTVLVRGIANDKFALGFIPYAYFSDAEGKLKALAIEWDYDALNGRQVKSAPVYPSNRAVNQGHYIPFARPLFLYVSVPSLAKPYLRDFLIFFLKNAGTYISKVNYLPLSEIAYRTAVADVERKKTGTRFGGEQAVGVAMHDLLARPRQ
jgi:phosphate transport system substrate-binding protein